MAALKVLGSVAPAVARSPCVEVGGASIVRTKRKHSGLLQPGLFVNRPLRHVFSDGECDLQMASRQGNHTSRKSAPFFTVIIYIFYTRHIPGSNMIGIAYRSCVLVRGILFACPARRMFNIFSSIHCTDCSEHTVHNHRDAGFALSFVFDRGPPEVCNDR